MGIQTDSDSGSAPHEVPTGVDTAENVGIGATFKAELLAHLYGYKIGRKVLDICTAFCLYSTKNIFTCQRTANS